MTRKNNLKLRSSGVMTRITDNPRLLLLVLIPLILLWGPALGWLVHTLSTTTLNWDMSRLALITTKTLGQAALSCIVSLGIACPVALALFRRRFNGQRYVHALLSICFILPPILVAYAILALWGRGGVMGSVWSEFTGSAWTAPFGWTAVILGHAMLNAPLAIRMFYLQLEQQPQSLWLTTSELRLSPTAMLRFIDYRILRSSFFPLSRLVFLYCMQSFAIVWLLGGGPQLTTLEVALFSALRQEADINWALQVMLVQIGIVGILILLPRDSLGQLSVLAEPTGQKTIRRPDQSSILIAICDYGILVIAAIIILAPLAALVANFNHGLRAMLSLLGQAEFYSALAGSLMLAIPAAILGCAMSSGFAYLLTDPTRRPSALLSTIPMSIFLVPFIALGSAWVLLSLSINLPSKSLILVIILALASSILPLGTAILMPVFAEWRKNVLPVIHELRIPMRYSIHHLAKPYFLSPLRQVLVWGLALGIGDLGLTSLFGKEVINTMPIYMQRLFGSYHTQDGQGLALWMLILYVIFHLTLFPVRHAHRSRS